MRKGKIPKSKGYVAPLKGTAAPRLGPQEEESPAPNVAGQSVLVPHAFSVPDENAPRSRDRRHVVGLPEPSVKGPPVQPGEPDYSSPQRRAHPDSAVGEQMPRGPKTTPARRIRTRPDHSAIG